MRFEIVNPKVEAMTAALRGILASSESTRRLLFKDGRFVADDEPDEDVSEFIAAATGV